MKGFSEEEDEVERLKLWLSNAPPMTTGIDDVINWKADKSGWFSVGSLYNLFVEGYGDRHIELGLVSGNTAPPRVNFVAWLAWAGRVKVAGWLRRIGIINDQADG